MGAKRWEFDEITEFSKLTELGRQEFGGIYGFTQNQFVAGMATNPRLKNSVILSEGEREIRLSNNCWPSRSRRTHLLFPNDSQGGWTYIMSSHSRCLCIGVTSDLAGRVWEHKNGIYQGFTKKYKIDQLVYYDCFTTSQALLHKRGN